MAFYSEDVIEDVKAANDIVDVVSGYVTLKRKGSNYFGACPFHREKTPSFVVNVDRQIYHCFGCGEGGNVIRFIMRIENIGFKEALEFLADRAKIVLPVSDFNNTNMSMDELKAKDYHKNQMYEINKIAGRFFYSNIEKSIKAQEYIKERKLEARTVARFGLGFATNDNSLYKHLLSKGFKEEDMIATGLIGKGDNGNLYDKFRDRFMFPIFDIRGRVVAFGGRTLESKEVMKEQHIPKYVNSPENLIYIKGKHLYGLNLAKASHEKIKKILVVEGYMDVISPHQAGVTNVVASLGTALTEAQGRLLRQYAEEVILSYDSDEAGQKAITRGLEVMQELGVIAKVLRMDGAKDPDEYVIKYGPDKFRRLIDDSISFVEYKVALLKKEYDLDITTDKIKFLNKLAIILSKIDNNIERDIYVDEFSKELNVGKEAILAEVEKITFKKKDEHKRLDTPILMESSLPKQQIDASTRDLENTIIYLLCEKDKKIYERLRESISTEDIVIDVNRNLIVKLYHVYEKEQIDGFEPTSLCETDEEYNILTRAMMKENVLGDKLKLADEIIKTVNNNKMQKRKKELVEMLQKAQGEEERSDLESQLNRLIMELSKR